MTNDLLTKYCEIYQLDKSRAIDELLYGRLEYLESARIKAKQKAEKEANKNYISIYKSLNNDTWDDLRWEYKKEQPDLEKFKKVGLTLEQFRECYESKNNGL